MDFHKIWEEICFIGSPLQDIAAAVVLIGKYRAWKRAKKRGKMPIPKIVTGLVIFSVVVAGIGFWLVLHPPQVQTAESASSNSSGGIVATASPGSAPNTTPAPSRTMPTIKLKSPRPEKAPSAIQPPPPQTSQAVPTPPSIVIAAPTSQVASAPCSGNAIGGGVDNSGCSAGPPPPPPARRITQANGDEAVAILKTAPQGSSVYFVTVTAGDDDEINFIARQIKSIFAEGGWVIVRDDNIGDMPFAESRGEGLHKSLPFGIACGPSYKRNNAADTAIAAMKAAGVPCAGRNEALQMVMMRMGRSVSEVEPDVYISIATRIEPTP